MSHVGISAPRAHLKVVSDGRRTATAGQFRGPDPIDPPAQDWSLELFCRSGCLVVAPGATLPTVFWAGVLVPLLRAFAGPVVLDTISGNVDASAIAGLALTSGSLWLTDCPTGHLRVVVRPVDLLRARRQLGPAGIGVFESLPDATDSSK